MVKVSYLSHTVNESAIFELGIRANMEQLRFWGGVRFAEVSLRRFEV